MRRALAAFVRRDFRVAMSARVPFLLEAASAALTVTMFAMVSKIVPTRAVPGGYLTFALIGIAFAGLLQAGTSVLATGARAEQSSGTLEATLAAGVGARGLAAGMAAYPILASLLRAGIVVAIAAIAGARAPGADWPVVIVSVAMASVAFAGIGLIAASLALMVHQAVAVVAWLVSLVSLLGGTVFPPSVLPGWVRPIADASPFTHALKATRAAALEGAGFADLAGTLLLQAGLAVLFPVIGIIALAAALKHLRRTGRTTLA